MEKLVEHVLYLVITSLLSCLLNKMSNMRLPLTGFETNSFEGGAYLEKQVELVEQVLRVITNGVVPEHLSVFFAASNRFDLLYLVTICPPRLKAKTVSPNCPS